MIEKNKYVRRYHGGEEIRMYIAYKQNDNIQEGYKSEMKIFIREANLLVYTLLEGSGTVSNILTPFSFFNCILL